MRRSPPAALYDIPGLVGERCDVWTFWPHVILDEAMRVKRVSTRERNSTCKHLIFRVRLADARSWAPTNLVTEHAEGERVRAFRQYTAFGSKPAHRLGIFVGIAIVEVS